MDRGVRLLVIILVVIALFLTLLTLIFVTSDFKFKDSKTDSYKKSSSYKETTTSTTTVVLVDKEPANTVNTLNYKPIANSNYNREYRDYLIDSRNNFDFTVYPNTISYRPYYFDNDFRCYDYYDTYDRMYRSHCSRYDDDDYYDRYDRHHNWHDHDWDDDDDHDWDNDCNQNGDCDTDSRYCEGFDCGLASKP